MHFFRNGYVKMHKMYEIIAQNVNKIDDWLTSHARNAIMKAENTEKECRKPCISYAVSSLAFGSVLPSAQQATACCALVFFGKEPL